MIFKQEWKNFIDRGIVPSSRINKIAAKLKAQKQLSVREQAIFMDKTHEINEILKLWKSS